MSLDSSMMLIVFIYEFGMRYESYDAVSMGQDAYWDLFSWYSDDNTYLIPILCICEKLMMVL